MLFKTTEQHEALRAKVREFAETEVKPIGQLESIKIQFAVQHFSKNALNIPRV